MFIRCGGTSSRFEGVSEAGSSTPAADDDIDDNDDRCEAARSHAHVPVHAPPHPRRGPESIVAIVAIVDPALPLFPLLSAPFHP